MLVANRVCVESRRMGEQYADTIYTDLEAGYQIGTDGSGRSFSPHQTLPKWRKVLLANRRRRCQSSEFSIDRRRWIDAVDGSANYAFTHLPSWFHTNAARLSRILRSKVNAFPVMRLYFHTPGSYASYTLFEKNYITTQPPALDPVQLL